MDGIKVLYGEKIQMISKETDSWLREVSVVGGFVVIVALFFILWQTEDAKFNAVYTCDRQERWAFGFDVGAEAPEWCVIFWDSDYFKRTRGPIQLTPRAEGCLPYTRGAC